MLNTEQVREYAAKISELDSPQEREDYLRSLNITDSDDQRAIAEEVAWILKEKQAAEVLAEAEVVEVVEE